MYFCEIHLDESQNTPLNIATSLPLVVAKGVKNSISGAESVYSLQHSIVHLSVHQSINVARQI